MTTAFNDLESDLKVVLNTVIVNPYYKSIVTKQFKALISSCSHSQASSLATKVAPETESILLCASLLDNKISEESLAQALAERLNQSPTDFKLSSYDPDIVSSCQEMSSRDWNVGDADYYLVLWTLSTGADKNALEQCQTAGACSYNIDPFVYFQYTDFTTSSCGNGLREAGESCDLFIYTGKEGYGCSKQCHTIPGHECTTQHLEQSFCSKTVCGDGRRTSDEECDEGTASSVGCNPQSCTIQEGYRCEGSYNATSYCTELLTPSQIVPTSSTKLVINPPTSSPVSLPRESPSGVEAFEAEPTNGGLASGAHSMQRTLHLWNVVLTSLLVFLLFNLIWR